MTPFMIAGVDEAGRGPVVGPMVVAGVALPREELGRLEELGVDDSKRLSPKRREAVALGVRSLPGIRIITVHLAPYEIDAAVRNRSLTLNGLTLSTMALILEKLAPSEAYCDLVGSRPEAMERQLMRLMSARPRLTVARRADTLYPITSAASIIAKTERDAAIRELNEKLAGRYGPVGSGYPSDARTRRFVLKAGKDARRHIRWTWGTIANLRRRGARAKKATRNDP
ncbi:MAG: ribonuclease HII [Candidatus Hydrogenedentota bacterium]|nr:MAG: ribonuclease HII [Candidatus Hydrogenedentota bacterium]